MRYFGSLWRNFPDSIDTVINTLRHFIFDRRISVSKLALNEFAQLAVSSTLKELTDAQRKMICDIMVKKFSEFANPKPLAASVISILFQEPFKIIL